MSLFGEAPEPKKPKVVKPRSENADAVLRIEARYTELFKERWKFEPKRNYGRDRKELGELERLWGETEVLDLLQLFFVTTDPKIVRCDYTVTAFCALAQHLKLNARRPQDERTIANLDAAARAMGRRP